MTGAIKKKVAKTASAKQQAARRKFALAAKTRSRKPNKTIIVKPKRVLVVNGRAVRRKYRNGYLDLVIRGQAKKTASGWTVGKKTIPQGKGIAPLSSGYYLDRSTGQVFARRVRNSDHRDTDHPIEVTKHWRQGPPGYLTQWQRAHHAGQQGLFEHGIKPAKVRSRNPKRKRNSTAAEQARNNRREFAGSYAKDAPLWFPSGTPDGLSKLGELALIKLSSGAEITPASSVWLCRDLKARLHLGSVQKGAMLTVPAGNYGPIKSIEYVEAKPQLGEKRPVVWVHKLGELTGEKPDLTVDTDGQVRIKGGAYSITWRGIEN